MEKLKSVIPYKTHAVLFYTIYKGADKNRV